MSLFLQTAIDIAVHILNDEGHITYTETELLKYANDSLNVLVNVVPQYFYACGELGCITGRCLQSINFVNAHALVSVDKVKNGDIVLPIEKAALDKFNPNWCNSPPGPAKNWARHFDNPIKFYIYPPAPEGQILQVTYVKSPDKYTATERIDLPSTFSSAIADYIVGMAMSKDDEHINANRAQMFLASFMTKVKGA